MICARSIVAELEASVGRRSANCFVPIVGRMNELMLRVCSRVCEAMSAMALNQKHNCATHFHARIGMLSEPVKRDEPLPQRYT